MMMGPPIVLLLIVSSVNEISALAVNLKDIENHLPYQHWNGEGLAKYGMAA